jgi:hypothetical protein
MTTQANVDALNAAAGALVAGQVTQPQVDAVNAAAANITVDAIGGTGATGSTGSSGSTGETGLPPGFTSVSVVQTDQYAPVQGTNQRWNLNLHGSGGAQLAHGDQMDIVVDETMGHVAGQVFRLAAEKKVIGTETTAQLEPADRVWLTRPGYLTNTWMETLWRGYILDNNTTSPAVPYTERRLDAAIAYARATKYPWLSATKVTASGGSMGAWGMMTYALRRPQVFAAIFASRPRWRDINYADWAVGFARDYHGNPMADVAGQTVAQRQDHVTYVTDPANAIPFLVFALGRADGYGKFSDFTDAIAALRATGRGFACYWNAGNHSDPDIVNMTQLGSYQKAMFEIGVGYPVISRSSLDNDPAVDQVGGINLGFSWTNVVETATAWSCDLANALGAVTVTVAPHSSIFPGAPPQTVTIPAGQSVHLSFSAGLASPTNPPTSDLPPVAPPDAPLTGQRPTINRVPLNLAAIVCLRAQYATSRYQRYKVHTDQAGTIAAKFGLTDLAGGGARKPFGYPKYGLLINGVERATYTRSAAGTETEGTFTGALGDEADGPVLTQIVAYDASGARVASPTECLMPYWVWVDRQGKAKDCPDVIVDTGSFSWTHVAPVYAWARIPKTALGNLTKPLPSRVPVPSDTALDATKIARVDRVPVEVGEAYRPTITDSGITVMDDLQPYFNDDMTRAWSQLPLVDGIRGACSAAMVTFLRFGRNRKLYGCDPFSFWVIDETGTKRTLIGQRMTTAEYWVDTKSGPSRVETVGNWDASIPEKERFPWECWGMCWDPRTLALDPNAAPIGGEQPHAGAGPVAYLSDRHGYLLKVQFDGHNHATPAIVTRVAAFNDLWGLDWDPATNTIIGAERGAHRIVRIDPATGKVLEVLVDASASAKLVTLVANTHEYKWAAGTTQAQIDAAPGIAPELIVIQDGYLYFTSIAMRAVRRINLATKAVELCCRPTFNANSHFSYIALSDGTFGPRGTIFHTSYSNGFFGRAQAFLPVAGGGLTHSKVWGWQGSGSAIVQGSGGHWEAMEYAIAVAVGEGMLAQGNSNQGIATFMQADPVLDVKPDAARAARGMAYWKQQCYPLIWGPYGYGYTRYPLPLGENADCDYWLTSITKAAA